MKSVKSVADLHRAALAAGASVTLNGSRFNTAGQRMAPAPRPQAPAPVAAPPPEPPPAPAVQAAPVIHVDLGEALSASLTAQYNRLDEAVRAAVAALPAPAPPAAPEARPTSWRLTPVRDAKGLITHIDVKAR